jgi:hypothetical protein
MITKMSHILGLFFKKVGGCPDMEDTPPKYATGEIYDLII